MNHYRVCDAVTLTGHGRTYYLGNDPAEAWHKYRTRCAIEPLTGTRGVALMQWNPADIGRWETVRQIMPHAAGI